MEETLEKIIKDYKENEGNIVSILQQIQSEFNYIPDSAVSYISRRPEIPASKFYGVATFYAQFHLKPRGKNILTLCCGTACHVRGSDKIISRMQQELALAQGVDTTEDGKFTLEKVACVGACSIAPVSIVNHKVHGKSTVNQLLKIVKELSREAS